MDNRICDGGCTWTSARYEALSSVAGYFFGQCAAYPMGISYVRNNGNIIIFHLDVRFDRAQASICAIATFLCTVRNGVFAAMRYNVDNVIERAWNTFAMPTRWLCCRRFKVCTTLTNVHQRTLFFSFNWIVWHTHATVIHSFLCSFSVYRLVNRYFCAYHERTPFGVDLACQYKVFAHVVIICLVATPLR